jgi:hypothetical protein
MSKGALIFAHNNEEIDYVKIACLNALMIKRNLDVGVTLVTDDGTLGWAKESLGEEFLNKCFENIITEAPDYVYKQNNIRAFKDTVYTVKHLPFYNCDHWRAYELSPYDETLFIDADYLIMSSDLNRCRGSAHDIMINKDIKELFFGRVQENNTVGKSGIDTYWATCIYFRKSELAEHLFYMVKYIYDNYAYYRDLYSTPNAMFRNDYAFSIAVHIMNGFSNSDLIKQLPIPALYKSFDNDDIISINGLNDITLLLEKPKCTGDYILSRFKNLDVHIMNKWAILRNYDKLKELYSE